DCLCVAEFHRRGEVTTSPLKGALGDLTGGRALLTDEEPLAAHQGRLNLSPPSPRMLGRHNEDEFVEQPRRHALLSGPKGVPADYPEIHLVPADPLFDEGR